MKDIQLKKKRLRKEIFLIKKTYSQAYLDNLSVSIVSELEKLEAFSQAKSVFIYNNLPDEVATVSLMNKWILEKDFYLPVITGDKIIFRKYTKSVSFNSAVFGILEPEGDDFINYDQIDLIIVPGVAFDSDMNRLGRGKGYYDRFLSQVQAPKVGICFGFQILDNVPAEKYDIKMDYVVSEKGTISQ